MTTGRVTLDKPRHAGPQADGAAGRLGLTLWLADGVGIVQSLNKYAHMYQLVESTLK